MQRSDFLKLARFFEIFDFLKKMLKGSEASISNLNEQLASFLRFFEIFEIFVNGRWYGGSRQVDLLTP